MSLLITGGNGQFAKHFVSVAKKESFEILSPSKLEMDIRNRDKINYYFKTYNNSFNYVIHAAAITTPMSWHLSDPKNSIETNIIGTANIVLSCQKYRKKLIYISTTYVYPGIKGNYDEDSDLNPVNEYAWSKLGGECSVNLYKNSLILRICMTRNPFPHKNALVDVKNSYIYNDQAAKIVIKLIDQTGIVNIGGKQQSIYDFAEIDNPDVGKIRLCNISDVKMAKNSSVNIDKMNMILLSL